MEQWIVETMETFGYYGMFLLILLENLFPPLPSELILSFGGFMTTYTHLSMVGLISLATLGSVSGALILYYVGRICALERLYYLVERWGTFLRLKKADFLHAQRWFEKYGYRVIFFGRFVPLVRSLISIPAGMAKMNLSIFLLLTLLGALIWNATLIFVGAWLGQSWGLIVSYLAVYAKFIYIGLMIAVITVVALWILRFFREQK